jgi:isoleucyl-tRNA synthetase
MDIASYARLQLSPHDTPAVVIREAAKYTALSEVESQKEQFRSLGIMADWDSMENTYRTSSSRSALTEAELEYHDHVSESAYIAFELDTGCSPSHPELAEAVSNGISIKFLVWTTTPWTLTANMAIAVHEDLVYELLLDQNVAYLVSSDRIEAVSKILNIDSMIRLASLPGMYIPCQSNYVSQRCR